jgi:hypothetical protein
MSDRTTGREVGRGKSGMLFFDHTQRNVAPMAEGFRRPVE